MIDFYYAPTPNGWKISIMLEETSIPYKVIPVNLGKGDQFKPEFLAISPNNRMPVIVDHEGPDGFDDGGVVTDDFGEVEFRAPPEATRRDVELPLEALPAAVDPEPGGGGGGVRR